MHHFCACVYADPSVTTKVFNAFQCIDFPEIGKSFLRKDLSIDCDSPNHQIMQYGYASIMVVLYPVGVPLLLMSTLWLERAKLIYWADKEAAAVAAKKLTDRGLADPRPVDQQFSAEKVRELAHKNLSKVVNRVSAGYELRTAWFEVFEMFRKLLLLGVAAAFPTGSLTQLIYGLIICFVSFGAFMLLAPYEDDGEDQLAQLAQLQVFLVRSC